MSPQNNTEHEAALLLPFRAIVGKCMYLSTCTRPDISFAVRELARFMSNYGQQHYNATKHLLRYLQGMRSHGIVYSDTDNMAPIFQSFSDSDWAMCKTQKSISGFIIQCGGGPISWSSKQQPLVALSTCEAEYLACTHCACHIIWLHSLFHKLGISQTTPSILYCDNQGTVACTHDPHAHSKMKHIDIRLHFIRSCVNQHIIDIYHIPGVENPADLLTKPLDKIIHQKWVARIQMNKEQQSIK
jgi:hypothetical protein